MLLQAGASFNKVKRYRKVNDKVASKLNKKVDLT